MCEQTANLIFALFFVIFLRFSYFPFLVTPPLLLD
jgi:hypothetical protein